jgi:hypothetical protein
LLSLISNKTFCLKSLVGKQKLLSQAARTTLIKTMANAIPSYTMSLFLLLKNLCNDLESNLRKFWWGYPLEKKHNLMLLGWNKTCSSKAWGGLGIRPLETQNRSLLAKLGWNILTKNNILWVSTLKSKYLINSDFLQAKIPPKASWLWKAILECRSVIGKGACWSISLGSI